MIHRHHRFVRTVTALIPALVTASCSDVVVVGSVPGPDDEPPPAMTGGSPPTSNASSGSGGGGGASSGSGGSAGSSCDWSGRDPTLSNNTHHQEGTSVAVDAAGNVALAGRFQGTLDLGDSPALEAKPEKAFVAKLDACGNTLWTRALTSDTTVGIAVSVAFDGYGDIVAAGYEGLSEVDFFLSKLDPNGDVLWTKSFAAAYDQYAFDVATDINNDILVTGAAAGDVLFDNGQEIHGGGSTFLAKLSPAGHTLWAMSFPGTSQGRGLAVDSAGDIILTGKFEGAINLGGATFQSPQGLENVFLAKFNQAGEHVWSMSFATSSISKFLDVAVDSADAIIVTGAFNFSVDLGGGPLISAPHESTFLAKFSPAGDHLWSRALTSGPEGFTYANGIAAAVDGAIIVGGFFTGTLALCGDPLVSSEQDDIFLAKFDASGNCLASQRYGGPLLERPSSVASSPSGGAVLTGSFLPEDYNFDGMKVITNGTVRASSMSLFVGLAAP